MRELIDLYSPDYLWNDIDWPDGGKGDEPYGLAQLFTHYLTEVPTQLSTIVGVCQLKVCSPANIET